MSTLEKLVLIREDRETGLAPDLGKMVPHFQRCGFPLQKPPADYLTHERHDGDIKIVLEASPRFGMPFGADILTLLWCFTTALDHKSRTIRFHAAANILRDMNLPPDGRNYKAVVNSFKRIYGASYFFEWSEIIPGKGKRTRSFKRSLFDSLSLWFHENDDQIPLQGKGFENEIVLSDFAWNWLRRTSWIETAPAYALR